MIRDGVVEPEVGLSYATNTGNLRLNLADFLAEQAGESPSAASSSKAGGGTEMEIER